MIHVPNLFRDSYFRKYFDHSGSKFSGNFSCASSPAFNIASKLAIDDSNSNSNPHAESFLESDISVEDSLETRGISDLRFQELDWTVSSGKTCGICHIGNFLNLIDGNFPR